MSRVNINLYPFVTIATFWCHVFCLKLSASTKSCQGEFDQFISPRHHTVRKMVDPASRQALAKAAAPLWAWEHRSVTNDKPPINGLCGCTFKTINIETTGRFGRSLFLYVPLPGAGSTGFGFESVYLSVKSKAAFTGSESQAAAPISIC